jgi:FMN phosphatase YigB (HAD superfamily)
MSTSRDWRAVIFDLWDTLVPFPSQLIAERDAALAETLAVEPDELRSAWLRLEPVWQTGAAAAEFGAVVR